jgi:thioredoxin
MPPLPILTELRDRAHFAEVLQKNPGLFIVKFGAEWCGPCKKLKPELEALEAAHKGEIKIVRIDVDKNKTLARELQITEIPIIMIYKNKQILWTGTGYFPMKDIEVNCGF